MKMILLVIQGFLNNQQFHPLHPIFRVLEIQKYLPVLFDKRRSDILALEQVQFGGNTEFTKSQTKKFPFQY